MAVNNIGMLFRVTLYTILDLLVFILVFVYHRADKQHFRREILRFTFHMSSFDLVLLAFVRFILINATVVCLGCKGCPAIQKWKRISIGYGCVQAVYIVMKILVFTAHKKHVPLRFWILVGATLFSCVICHFCWLTLISYKKVLDYRIAYRNRTGAGGEVIENTRRTESVTSELGGYTPPEKKNEHGRVPASEVIYKLFKMAKPDFILILLALVALVICSLSQSVMPYYTGLVVNYIVIDRSIEEFHGAIIYMALLTFLAGCTAGIRAGLFKFIFGRYKLRMQSELFSNIMKMEIGFFDNCKTGEIMSRLTTDCTKIGDGIGLRLNTFIRSIVKSIGILYFMLKLSWKLSIVTLVAIPIFAVVSDYFGSKYKNISENVQNNLAYANSFAEEAISSMKTVRSFAAEYNESSRYSGLLDVTRKHIRRQSLMSAFYRWSTEITSFIMLVLILYYGGHLVIISDLNGGNLVSFILYSFELTYCIQDIGNVYTGLMEVVGASRKVFYYITRKPLVEQSGKFIPENGMMGNVEFKNITFTYPSRKGVTVLRDVSFTAARGEVVALVGPSGGGKTSIINLLQNFYHPEEGEILIDNISIKNYNHAFLHKYMSIVQQEPVLFARTISENITYGVDSNDITEDDINMAAELANVDSFVASLPNKYETETGARAVQLSGGQKQRIAIARALIRKPTVLLLDEATSALDSDSEHLVQQAINRNLSGRTVIVIAHRLSTVENADKILVLSDGRIVEEGNHKELLKQQGVYATLVSKQMTVPGENGT